MIQKPKVNFIFVISLRESNKYDINCKYLNIKHDTDKKKRNSKSNKTLKMKQGQNKQYKH